MKSTDVLTQLKSLLGMDVQLEEMKLSNGTVLEAEKFEEGEEVFIKTEDEKVALPEGIYDLEDQRQLVVLEEGLISEIKTEEQPQKQSDMQNEETAILEEEKKEEKQEMGYATKEELAEVKMMVEEIKAMIEAKAEEKEEKEEMAAEEPVAEEAEELKEELSKPAAPAIKHSPEAKAERKQVLHSQSRPMTTLDKIMSKISNIQ